MGKLFLTSQLYNVAPIISEELKNKQKGGEFL